MTEDERDMQLNRRTEWIEPVVDTIPVPADWQSSREHLFDHGQTATPRPAVEPALEQQISSRIGKKTQLGG
jgi:hypothetical protein